jgi:hypothetical protein
MMYNLGQSECLRGWTFEVDAFYDYFEYIRSVRDELAAEGFQQLKRTPLSRQKDRSLTTGTPHPTQRLAQNEQRIAVLDQQKQTLIEQAKEKEERIAYLKE